MIIRGVPTMYCPCVNCLNQKKFAQWDNIFDHLITHGFKNKYTCWNRHGEEGLNEGEAECLNEGEALRHARGLNEGGAQHHDDEALNEGELIHFSLLQGKAECLTSLEYFHDSLICHYYRGRMRKLWGRRMRKLWGR